MSRFRSWLSRPARPHQAAGANGLEICLICGSDFVYPVNWAESGPNQWWLLLRCGACDTWRDAVADNHAVEEYDRVLDEGMAAIQAARERSEQESLTANADAFGTALRLDLLSADDFRLG